MEKELEKIFELETEYNYDEAFLKYKQLLNSNHIDFDLWKYYYFFLWSMLEDLDNDFTILEKSNLKKELNIELEFGRKNFVNIAEFNFIAGYTISIFPYEFGDYAEFQNLGKNFLKAANKMDTQNSLYRMVVLGNSENLSNNERNEYEELRLKVSKQISEDHSGKGILNEYYRSVFIL